MPTIKLNGNPHDVQPVMIETITSRLNARLLRARNENHLAIDDHAVIGELNRLYSSIHLKPWYHDFVVQFCKDRRIALREGNLRNA